MDARFVAASPVAWLLKWWVVEQRLILAVSVLSCYQLTRKRNTETQFCHYLDTDAQHGTHASVPAHSLECSCEACPNTLVKEMNLCVCVCVCILIYS